MAYEAETMLPDPKRTAFRRDLYRAHLVIGQLRDEALASGETFQVADLALDAAALNERWDGLDRVDTHFWEEESLRRYMENRTFGIRRDAAQQGAGRNRVVQGNRATGPAFTAGGWRRCGTS